MARTMDEKIEHIADEARRAAAKRNNNWPGLPVSSLPMSLNDAAAEGIRRGRLVIQERPNPTCPKHPAQYICVAE
jgi:hypothetical protein